MKLSIIIVNFNTNDLVRKCIDSIKKSGTKLSYEIIIVDNGSSERIEKSNEFELIENKENLGFAKANNRGIKVAKGKYILLLNSDTLVEKGSIDSLYDFAIAHSDAGVVGAQLKNIDGTIQPSVFHFPSVTRAIREYWLGQKGNFELYVPESKEAVTVDSVVGAAFLITPQALAKVGLLDERYFMYFEDLDYCERVWKKNLKVYYLPSSKIIHYHGASGRKIVKPAFQWNRLIPSSKIYHGTLKHYLLNGLTWLGQKGGLLFFALLLFLIPSFKPLLRQGFFPMQDDLQAFRVYEMDRCFDDFQIPCRWVPDAGYQYGYPQFNYYPPLPYYVGALMHRGGVQYIDSVKILFIFGYIASALAMYILVESIVNKWAAFVTALLYTYIPYKAVEVYVRGALSEFWAQIFFPLIFWSSYKLIKTGKIKFAMLFSIFLSLLLTTHTLMSMIFAPIAALWVVYWLFRERWNNFLKVLWGGLLGFGLSAFFTLPVIFERKFVHVESLLSGYFDYRAHFVSLYKLFLSMEWGYGSSGFPNEKLNLSIGVVQWIFALVVVPTLVLIFYKKKKKLSILVAGLVLIAIFTIFMMHMKSSFIWAKLPFLWYLQFPWRFLAVSIFLITLLIGLGFNFLTRFKYLIGVALIILSFGIYIHFFVPKAWLNISDREKFSGLSWEKQLTISIFDYLPVTATLPPTSKAPDEPEVLSGKANFSSYEKGSDFQTGEVVVERAARLRIPLYDFPGMKVALDGEKISYVNNDCRGEKYCLGLVTFDVPPGKHTIKIVLTDTPIRKIGNWLTLISLGILVFLILKKKNEEVFS